MSAIAGLWRLDGSPRCAAACARMLEALSVYGPHADARWDQGDVAMGRRLFRSLPEDLHDRGVAVLGDGGRLVADVRLDNRAELEVELGLAPDRARAMADSALLAAAWDRWSEGCFDHLAGDYAFAVWDPRRRRLTLARDPFGQRPLVFHRARGFIAFASMPRGLHALPEIPLEPDEDQLAAFLALRPEVGSATFFAGVERVEPGCTVRFDGQGFAGRRHYAPSRRPSGLAKPDDYVQALREQLDRAVACRLRGAGDLVGSHLSSGWDSAAVAATAARLLEPLGGRLVAFTAAPRAGYDGPVPRGRHGDESKAASELAALYANMEHAPVRGVGRSPLEDLDRDIAFNGRPALNACNHVWLNDINRAAQTRGIGVVLTGDFGNLGLTADGVDALGDLAASGSWRRWLALARAARRSGALRWRGVLAASIEPFLPPGLAARLRRLAAVAAGDRGAHSALAPHLWARFPPLARPRGGWAQRRLAAMTRIDGGPYAKGVLAAFGVDVRDPLADRRLIEFCLAAPIEAFVQDGRTRSLARRALADRVPSWFLEQPTRGYQGVDWHEGLSRGRDGVARDLERLAEAPMAVRLIDIDRLRALVSQWPASGWETDEVLDAYRLALLRGLAAGRFITRTLGTNV